MEPSHSKRFKTNFQDLFKTLISLHQQENIDNGNKSDKSNNSDNKTRGKFLRYTQYLIVYSDHIKLIDNFIKDSINSWEDIMSENIEIIKKFGILIASLPVEISKVQKEIDPKNWLEFSQKGHLNLIWNYLHSLVKISLKYLFTEKLTQNYPDTPLKNYVRDYQLTL